MYVNILLQRIYSLAIHLVIIRFYNWDGINQIISIKNPVAPIWVMPRHTGLLKNKYTLSKIYFTKKLLTLNPCLVHLWKGNLSKLWYRWSEAAHHWRCGCWNLLHAATSVGRAGLSIWHLSRHTWGSHRVLVRCENNFESSPLSLYIARRYMFNSTCKIHF
jgi:hypothetical protein